MRRRCWLSMRLGEIDGAPAVVSQAGMLNVRLVADPTLLTSVDQLAAGMQAEAALIGCLPPA